MKIREKPVVFFSTAVAALALIVLATAWFQIQSLRWGYRAQDLRRKLEELDKREQGVNRRLQRAMTLARLDVLAKTRYRLHIPKPEQVVLMSDG